MSSTTAASFCDDVRVLIDHCRRSGVIGGSQQTHMLTHPCIRTVPFDDDAMYIQSRAPELVCSVQVAPESVDV